jgi:UDP-N-acetylmuramoyl-tripeptide--D-alanyl-D-alanine ligase
MKVIFKKVVQFYLKVLTKIVLWRHNPLIIAVAGTTNKTFVKETILDELGRGPKVRGNPKSFNTEIGLPLAVLFLPSGYSSIFRWVDVLLTGTCISFFARRFPKVLVLEMGVDRKGDMKYLLSLVKPRVAVVTNLEKVFSNQNITQDQMAKEIETLIDSLPQKGLAILNGDDPWLNKIVAKKKEARLVTFGRSRENQAQIRKVRDLSSGHQFEFSYEGEKEVMETDRYGEHNINALVIARIVGEELKGLKGSEN